MVRIPVPSLLTAITLGKCLWNISIFSAMWILAVFCLSPALMMVGLEMPWMSHTINILYLFLGTAAGVYLIKYSFHFGWAGLKEFQDAS